MNPSSVKILNGRQIESLLLGQEADILELTSSVYRLHSEGKTSLPHSVFVRFPEQPRDRIIALPAFLGGTVNRPGIKWISSFPGNKEKGMDRASAVTILNSPDTGRPVGILEGTVISSKRTAASAALAARILNPGTPPASACLVGCGPINFEIARFLKVAFPDLATLFLFDIHPERSHYFREKWKGEKPGMEVVILGGITDALKSSRLISLATTAIKPHIASLSNCMAGSVILHISLRDLEAEVLLGCINVVDDADHACRASTSAHLAEQLSGSRAFIGGSLGDILSGRPLPPNPDGRPIVFSPFGLGILDLALADLTLKLAEERRAGLELDGFFPDPF